MSSEQQTQKPNNKSSQSSNSRGNNEEVQRFNLKDLGATRVARVVVYIAIGVIGTAETVFWGRWLWEWIAPDSKTEMGREGQKKPEDDLVEK